MVFTLDFISIIQSAISQTSQPTQDRALENDQNVDSDTALDRLQAEPVDITSDPSVQELHNVTNSLIGEMRAQFEGRTDAPTYADDLQAELSKLEEIVNQQGDERQVTNEEVRTVLERMSEIEDQYRQQVHQEAVEAEQAKYQIRDIDVGERYQNGSYNLGRVIQIKVPADQADNLNFELSRHNYDNCNNLQVFDTVDIGTDDISPDGHKDYFPGGNPRNGREMRIWRSAPDENGQVTITVGLDKGRSNFSGLKIEQDGHTLADLGRDSSWYEGSGSYEVNVNPDLVPEIEKRIDAGSATVDQMADSLNRLQQSTVLGALAERNEQQDEAIQNERVIRSAGDEQLSEEAELDRIYSDAQDDRHDAEIAELQQENEASQQQDREQDESIEDLQEQTDEYQATIDSQKEVIDRQGEMNQALEDTVTQQNTTIQRANELIAAQQETNESLNAILTEKESQLEEAQNQLEEAQRQLEAAQRAMEEQMAEMNRMKAELEADAEAAQPEQQPAVEQEEPAQVENEDVEMEQEEDVEAADEESSLIAEVDRKIQVAISIVNNAPIGAILHRNNDVREFSNGDSGEIFLKYFDSDSLWKYVNENPATADGDITWTSVADKAGLVDELVTLFSFLERTHGPVTNEDIDELIEDVNDTYQLN